MLLDWCYDFFSLLWETISSLHLDEPCKSLLSSLPLWTNAKIFQMFACNPPFPALILCSHLIFSRPSHAFLVVIYTLHSLYRRSLSLRSFSRYTARVLRTACSCSSTFLPIDVDRLPLPVYIMTSLG